jgi:DNA-binding YbaB/EbfC family protein
MAGPDLKGMFQQAQALQAKMMKAQEEAKKKSVEASSGGGMVTVTVSGSLEVTALKIDTAVIDPKDPAMLEDLIRSAVNQGLQKAQEMTAEGLKAATGGLSIPGLF